MNEQNIALQNLLQFENAQYKMITDPTPTESMNYFEESCKLYLANILLTSQLKEILQEKINLAAKINRLERNHGEIGAPKIGSSKAEDDRKRRYRRSAAQIERSYNCPITVCSKSYGSEGSLQQHLKLKHPEFNLKDYQFQSTIVRKGDYHKNDDDDESQSMDEEEFDEMNKLQQESKNENEQQQEKEDEPEEHSAPITAAPASAVVTTPAKPAKQKSSKKKVKKSLDAAAEEEEKEKEKEVQPSAQVDQNAENPQENNNPVVAPPEKKKKKKAPKPPVVAVTTAEEESEKQANATENAGSVVDEEKKGGQQDIADSQNRDEGLQMPTVENIEEEEIQKKDVDEEKQIELENAADDDLVADAKDLEEAIHQSLPAVAQAPSEVEDEGKVQVQIEQEEVAAKEIQVEEEEGEAAPIESEQVDEEKGEEGIAAPSTEVLETHLQGEEPKDGIETNVASTNEEQVQQEEQNQTEVNPVDGVVEAAPVGEDGENKEQPISE